MDVVKDGANRVSDWGDQSGLAHHYGQGTPDDQPTWEAAGFNGKPSILFDGVNEYLINETTLAADLCGDSDNSFFLMWAGQFNALTTTFRMFGFGSSSSAQPLVNFGLVAGPLYRATKRDDAGGTANTAQDVGAPDTDPHIFEIHHTGTTCDIIVDGTTVRSAPGASNVGTLTLNRAGLGAMASTTISGFTNCRIAEFYGANGVPDADELTALRAYFGRYS